MKRDRETLKQGIDLKRLMLCLQGKIWLLITLTIMGAVIGGIGYQIARAMRMPITYEAVSKLYISFGVDESGEVYQYYNGYTWNDLLDTDPIMARIEEFMPAEYTREEVIEATTAEILSDIRLLTITVQGGTEKFVREIQAAVEEGLVAYAGDSEELRRIQVIRTQEPRRVYWDDRTATACITGAVIMAVITALILAIIYVLDEAVYVQSDIEKKYPCRALGIMPARQKGLQPYARELKANIEYLMGEKRKFVLIDMEDHSDLRGMELERLLNAGENEFMGGDGELGGLTWTVPKEETEEKKEGAWEVIPMNEGALAGEECGRIREAGGAVLLLPFGTDTGRKTERVLNLLKNQDCRVIGMIVSRADEEFLHRYYG